MKGWEGFNLFVFLKSRWIWLLSIWEKYDRDICDQRWKSCSCVLVRMREKIQTDRLLCSVKMLNSKEKRWCLQRTLYLTRAALERNAPSNLSLTDSSGRKPSCSVAQWVAIMWESSRLGVENWKPDMHKWMKLPYVMCWFKIFLSLLKKNCLCLGAEEATLWDTKLV